MNYFNNHVIKNLSAFNVNLAPREINAYVNLCQFAQAQGREVRARANPADYRFYPSWHGPVSLTNANMNHWMIVPGQQPVMVNLVTAKVKEIRLPPKLQPSLSPAVMNALLEEKIHLTQDQIAAYEQIRNRSLGYKIPFKENKHDLHLPYSVWHAQTSATNPTMTSFLVLPAPADWKSKGTRNGQEIVPKILINLETGEKRVIKVRRLEKRFEQYVNREVENSIQEAKNNQIMGLDAIHQTRYSPIRTATGITATTKAYLFMPFYGKQNVMSYIKHTPNVPADKIIRLLIKGGRALQAVHDKGYLHLDFKWNNLVYDEDHDEVNLIDYENPMTQAQAAQGSRLLMVTKDHVHPDWMKRNEASFSRGGKVFYSIKNDVYAFVHTSDFMLTEAAKAAALQNNLALKKRIDLALAKVKQWKAGPEASLPTLNEVMQILQSMMGLIMDQEEGHTFKQAHRHHM